MNGEELQRLTAAQAASLDRLLAAVGEEHGREAEARLPSTRERRHAKRIERLLAGEPADTSEIAYDFDGWHVGVVAAGGGGEPALRDLATEVDCRLLLREEEGTIWAWLGSRRRLDPEELVGALPGTGTGAPVAAEPARDRPLAIALGEPAEALSGWRLTHRQAAAALPVALRGAEPVVRYADVALLAAALQDELLATSLRDLYVKPLSQRRDGHVLRETLRAYVGAEGNVSATASSLGVSRQTVRSRLRTAEVLLRRPLKVCAHAARAGPALDERRIAVPKRPTFA